ncbi:hypothetical protein RUND412_006754 [Rhizina undulata]
MDHSLPNELRHHRVSALSGRAPSRGHMRTLSEADRRVDMALLDEETCYFSDHDQSQDYGDDDTGKKTSERKKPTFNISDFASNSLLSTRSASPNPPRSLQLSPPPMKKSVAYIERERRKLLSGPRVVFRVFSLTCTGIIIGALARVVSQYFKTRNGRDGAQSFWPERIVLTPTVLVLFAACWTFIHEAGWLLASIWQRLRYLQTSCLRLMAALGAVVNLVLWVLAVTYAGVMKNKTTTLFWVCKDNNQNLEQAATVDFRHLCGEMGISWVAGFAVAIAQALTLITIILGSCYGSGTERERSRISRLDEKQSEMRGWMVDWEIKWPSWASWGKK